MKTLAIVGNAPLAPKDSTFIENADFVVRFNERNNVMDKEASRTDVLFINNTGRPAHRFTTRRPFVGSTADIWFARNSESHRQHFVKIKSHFPEYTIAELDDVSEEIIRSNGLNREKTHHVSYEVNSSAFNKLANASTLPFFCPSTGFLGIEQVLSSSDLISYEKHILAFGFEGWNGHPWEAERMLILSYEKAGLLQLHDAQADRRRRKSYLSKLFSKLVHRR